MVKKNIPLEHGNYSDLLSVQVELIITEIKKKEEEPSV